MQNPVPNKISLSTGYLEMLQCDDSNQQARQSLSLNVLAVAYHDTYVYLSLVFLAHWNQINPFLSKLFVITTHKFHVMPSLH